jgi:chromate transporter
LHTQRTWSEVFWVFLKLGSLGFGGPLAHVALMDEELVRRRQWLDRETFLSMHAATQLIPGPNSTELALHLGHREAGLGGLVAAGIGFIMPAMLSSIALGMLYVTYGRMPITQELLIWMRPVVLALVVRALVGFALQMPHRRRLMLGMILATVAGFLGTHELLILVCGGLMTACLSRHRSGLALVTPMLALPVALAPSTLTLGGLFGVFLKIGSVLFGSGYTLLLYLKADLVERHSWLTEAQLLDAITAGQVTPGPLFSSASFIGYILKGWPGGLLATLGIFLPAFIMIACGSWLFPRLLRSPWTQPLLEGVNIASLGLMLLVTWQIGVDSLQSSWQILLALAAGVTLWKTKLDPAWLIAGAAVAGLISHRI